MGKRREGVLAEVRNHLHADAPCAGSLLLHRDGDQNRFATFELAAATQPRLRTADPGVVEFDVPMQRFARHVHHRTAELVQQEPGGLVPTDRQLALKQQRRDPALVGRHQLGRPKPHRQREPGPMQDRARGQGILDIDTWRTRDAATRGSETLARDHSVGIEIPRAIDRPRGTAGRPSRPRTVAETRGGLSGTRGTEVRY